MQKDRCNVYKTYNKELRNLTPCDPWDRFSDQANRETPERPGWSADCRRVVPQWVDRLADEEHQT